MRQSFLRLLCLLAAMAPLSRASAATNSIGRTFSWEVEITKDETYTVPPFMRGEDVNLEPIYLEQTARKNLNGAHLVIFRYLPKTAALGSAYNVITGELVNAEQGEIRIHWDSTKALTNSAYRYEIAVQSTTEMMVSSKGYFSLLTGIGDNAVTSAAPVAVHYFDWATVDHANIGAAPFLSVFQIADLQTQLDTLFNGTAAAHVHSITSDVPYYGSATNLTDFPSYLARVGDLTPNSVTNVVKGSDEAVARIERVDDHNISVHFPIVGEGELQTTNRLYWVVDGVAVGYVSTNGITMLHGSLQLYEEDLDCNVRAYDGSVTAPSLSFYGSPLIGWYRKSVAGSYAWAFAHNSNDVGYVNNSGLTLLGTRVFTGYGAVLSYADVSDAYRIGGTNGLTTNINVIVAGGATQTLHFVGGLLLP